MRFGDGQTTWTLNFKPGLMGVSCARMHPNGEDVLVFAEGDCWAVSVGPRKVIQVTTGVREIFELGGTLDLIVNRQGLALARLGPEGVFWHTRRLSWDGLDGVEVRGQLVTGWGADLHGTRVPFTVDVVTGASEGGGFGEDPYDDWERLAVPARG